MTPSCIGTNVRTLSADTVEAGKWWVVDYSELTGWDFDLVLSPSQVIPKILESLSILSLTNIQHYRKNYDIK